MAGLLCRTLACLGLAGMLLAPAMRSAEPRPGTVSGLDVSTPEAAAASFLRSWSEGDYFVAYLALDPILRHRFMESVYLFDFQGLFGTGMPAGFVDRLPTHLRENVDADGPPVLTADQFADFASTIRSARDLGVALPRFDPVATGELVGVPVPGAAEALARVALPTGAGGGGVLVLRRSPEGRWRLVGVEKRDLPDFWVYQAE